MFEVIPNWHPLFVHFVVALLSLATLFFIALKIPAMQPLHMQFKTLAYWNLWLGTGFAIVTAYAGWLAYNSVAHDTPSHLAMTDHRNWALATLATYIVISLWSVLQYKSGKNSSMTFTLIIILASALLVSTGWRGSELVYRHGLGVMSLPQVEGEGHAHEHADGEGHGDTMQMNKPAESDDHGHSSHKKKSSGSHHDMFSEDNASSGHDSLGGHDSSSGHDKNEHKH